MAGHLYQNSAPFVLVHPHSSSDDSTAITSTGMLDMQTLGFNSVMIFGEQNASTGTGVDFTVQVSDDNSNWAAAVKNSTNVVARSTLADHYAIADLKQLDQRYVRVVYSLSTGGDFSGIHAICYDPRDTAPTVSSDVQSTGVVLAVRATTA